MVEESDKGSKLTSKAMRQNLGLTDKEPWWEKAQELPSFERDFYKESEKVASMTPEQVKELRAQMKINVKVYNKSNAVYHDHWWNNALS